MPQELIGCGKRRKLKALIPLVVVFVNDPPSAERKVDYAVVFVWWSYGRKICLNMYHGNSENSYGCSYLLWICFIYGTNVSVIVAELNPSASCWPLTRCFSIYQQTSADQNTVDLKSGFIWKFSWEWLFWTGYASRGPLKYWTKNIVWSLFKEFLLALWQTCCLLFVNFDAQNKI